MILYIVTGILCLIAGLLAGIRIGSYWSALKLSTVQEQLELQRQYSLEWSNAARNQNQLTQDIAQQQGNNLNNTMATIIHLLGALQNQQGQALEKTERDKVTELIQQARSITNSP